MRLLCQLTLITLLTALGGCAHHQVAAQQSDPRAVVAASVDAYNRQDFEAFSATLHPQVQLYAFPGESLYKTPHEAREAYRKLFVEAKDLKAHVSSRVVQGQYVIDQETIHGMPGKEPSKGVAIYKVEQGKIVAIWFID